MRSKARGIEVFTLHFQTPGIRCRGFFFAWNEPVLPRPRLLYPSYVEGQGGIGTEKNIAVLLCSAPTEGLAPV